MSLARVHPRSDQPPDHLPALPPPAAVRVPPLPYDVLALIFAVVAHADRCRGAWTRAAVSARQALARLARVNRTFHSLATRVLYRDVQIEFGFSSVEPVVYLVRDLDDESRLGVRPRRLWLIRDGNAALVRRSCRLTASLADLVAHGLLDGVTHFDVADSGLLSVVGFTSLWQALGALVQPAALTLRPTNDTDVATGLALSPGVFSLAIPAWASLRLVHLVDVPSAATLGSARPCDVVLLAACPHLSLIAWSFLRVRALQSFWRTCEPLLAAAAKASDRLLALEINLYLSPDHLERPGEVFAGLKTGLEELAPEGVSAERRLPELVEVSAQIGPVHVVLASHAHSELVAYA